MPTSRAVTRLRDLAEPGGSDVLRFNPENIEIEAGHNPRNFDTPEMRARLDEIKTSIAASGVHLPLMVAFVAGRAHISRRRNAASRMSRVDRTRDPDSHSPGDFRKRCR
jgi:hypothetical protein